MIEAVCRGRLRRSGRVPRDVRSRPRVGHARRGSALLLFVAAWIGLRDRPAGPAPLGLAKPPARATGAAARPQAPADRRPVAGIIELVRSDSEQARSRALCEAAIQQVAEDASKRDFRDAVPNPRHRLWGWLVGRARGWPPRGLLALCPAAATNAWARLLAPGATRPATRSPRVEPLPGTLVVAHGEPFAVAARLAEQTRLAAARGRGPARRAASRRRPAARRPLRVRAARRRSSPAGSTSASATRASASGSSRPASRADLGRRRRHAARLPGPPGSRSRRTCAAGPSRWSRGATASFTATASRDAVGSRRSTAKRRQPQGADGLQPGDQDRRRADDGVPLAGRVRPGGQGAVHAGDQRPRRRGPLAGLRGPAAPEGRARFRDCSASRSRPRTISASSASAWSGKGWRAPSSRRRPRASACWRPAGNDKETLEVGGTFSAKSLGIEPQPIDVRDLRRGLLPRPRAGLLAAVHALRAQRRAARDLAHRAAQQVAPPVAGSARPRDAALRDQQAAARLSRRRAGPARDPPADREPGRRPSGPTAGGCRTWSRPAKTWSSRPCATRSSASAISRSGPRCCRSSRTSPATACRRSPTCSSRRRRRRRRPRSAERDKTPMAGMVRDTRSGSRGRASRATPRRPRPAVPQVVDRESSQQPPDKNDGRAAAAKSAGQPAPDACP